MQHSDPGLGGTMSGGAEFPDSEHAAERGEAERGEAEPRESLEARLDAVHQRTEAGFAERARELRDAAEALEAGDESTRDIIRRLAHKLRGVAGSAGHEALGERAGRLEVAAHKEDIVALALIEGARRLASAAEEATRGRKGAPRVAPTVATRVPTAPKRTLGWRVIALDDESSTRRLLEITFRAGGGCDAEVHEDPGAAMKAILERVPDLIVVDAMMPDVDGLEFYRGVRQRCGAEVPIAILSAASPEELGWTLPEDPRLRWMRKPFRPGALLERLRTFVDGGESQ